MMDFLSQPPYLMKQIVMASPNGVLILQPVFKIDVGKLDLVLTDVNAIACQELSCPRKQVLGQPFHRYFPLLATQKTIERYWQVISTGKPIQFLLNELDPLSLVATAVSVSVSVIPLFPTLLVMYQLNRS
ncbi:PAS domain-containing protein [Spirosoma pollinicola]|uniref:Uncharacterized protein n=1 Tax=Spirosoma pollinicola TaxID=2057025 RepID=A0A2K8Z471_9BACT|nr:PAS domain-containing protein [Spirosoma pollinicola]AUD04665.1 hypothetical protein CWM47_24130 [Spirosoma pollinicola]